MLLQPFITLPLILLMLVHGSEIMFTILITATEFLKSLVMHGSM